MPAAPPSLDPADVERVRSMWRELCSAPGAFVSDGVQVVEVAATRAAPEGAIALVMIAGAGVAAGPGTGAIRGAIERLGVTALADVAAASSAFGPFAQTLGPAVLWYGHPTAVARHDVVGPLPDAHEMVAAVRAGATAAEVDESGLDAVPSGVFVALDAAGAPIAACGWHEWPHGVAHAGVLTVAGRRGEGFAASAAATALSAASGSGLVTQWRAAAWNAPSNALAARLGLVRLGSQLSVVLA